MEAGGVGPRAAARDGTPLQSNPSETALDGPPGLLRWAIEPYLRKAEEKSMCKCMMKWTVVCAKVSMEWVAPLCIPAVICWYRQKLAVIGYLFPV